MINQNQLKNSSYSSWKSSTLSLQSKQMDTDFSRSHERNMNDYHEQNDQYYDHHQDHHDQYYDQQETEYEYEGTKDQYDNDLDYYEDTYNYHDYPSQHMEEDDIEDVEEYISMNSYNEKQAFGKDTDLPRKGHVLEKREMFLSTTSDQINMVKKFNFDILPFNDFFFRRNQMYREMAATHIFLKI